MNIPHEAAAFFYFSYPEKETAMETYTKQLNDYEDALDAIFFTLALLTEAIHEERNRQPPNEEKLGELQQEFDNLMRNRMLLQFDDKEAIQCILNEYTPILKNSHTLGILQYNARPKGVILPEGLPVTLKDEPIAVIIGGQPGSGAQVLTSKAIARLGAGNYVFIDTDELRLFHPNFAWLAREDCQNADKFTHEDNRLWALRLVHDAIKTGRNIIIKQTLCKSSTMETIATEMRQAGYRIEMHVMAVSHEMSTLRICQRYERQRARYGYGRFTSQACHDKAYERLAETLRVVEDKKLVGRLCIYDISYNLIHENSLEKTACE